MPATVTRRGLRRALIGLCVTEIVSWGVLFYAFPVVLGSVVTSTGWSPDAAMGAFSTGLVVAAMCGVAVGRWMDRDGPRVVMTTGSALGVLGVLAVIAAPNLPLFFAAWALVGVAQSMLLYPPAFAALTRWYGPERVRALTILSLVAGLASTVFAPLTDLLVGWLGWRGCYASLAVLLGVVTIPVHSWCLRLPWPSDDHETEAPDGGYVASVVRQPRFILLTVGMVFAGFGMYAATVNLVPLFTSRGESNTLGAVALGLCGAGQLLGRVGYTRLSARTSPWARTVGVFVLGAATVGLLAAIARPAWLVILVAVAAGAVRGVHTLLQATAVSDRWGTRRFATINGVFSAPVTLVIAIAPFGGTGLAGLLGGYPAAFLALCGLIGLSALIAVATP